MLRKMSIFPSSTSKNIFVMSAGSSNTSATGDGNVTIAAMPTGTSYNDTSAVPAPAHAHDPVFGTPTAPGTLQPATALATSVPATAGVQPSVTTILPPPSLNVPHPNSPQALSSEDLSNSTVAALLAAGIQLQHQQRMNGDDFSCRRAGVGNHTLDVEISFAESTTQRLMLLFRLL